MAALYQEMLPEAERLATPLAIRAEFQLADVAELIRWLPEHASSVELALCTLGPAIESREKDLFPDEPHKAAVLDEISTALITALARKVHTAIKEQARLRGLKAGPPFRPGLGRWPLETQRVLFACLPAEKIGVVLDQHLMMRPIKSTSLVVPILNRTPGPLSR